MTTFEITLYFLLAIPGIILLVIFGAAILMFFVMRGIQND